MLSIVIPVFNEENCITDRKSLLAVRGVGRESEAESVRFPWAQSDKSGPGSQTRAFLGSRARPQRKKATARGLWAAEQASKRPF